MRLSCSTACLSGHSPADALREIANAGYAAAEVSAAGVEEAFGRGEEASRGLSELLVRQGLTVSSITVAAMDAESANDVPATVDVVCRHVRLARRLGLASVVVRAGDRRRQGLDVLVAGLREVAAYAGRLGMQVHLANGGGSRVVQLEDLRHVLADLPGEGVRIAVDCGEFHSAAVNPCHVFREFPERIGLVHVGDRIGKRPMRIGEGETNVPAIIEMAARCGYDGWVVVAGELPEGEDAAGFLGDARGFLEGCMR